MTDGGTPRFEIERELYGTYFAHDPDGRLTLLVPTSGGRPPLGRATGDVRLAFHAQGTFEVAGREFSCSAATIRCDNERLSETFRVLATDIAQRLHADQSRPMPQDVSRELTRWEQLLRSRKHFSREEEIGLWGELWTLLQLHDLRLGVVAWRGPGSERVDFVGGGVGVECKTSKSRMEHWISQDQVDRPLGDLAVYVLSLWVNVDAVEGRTVSQLVAEVDARLGPSAEFEEKLLATGYSRVDSDQYRLQLRLLERPALLPVDALPRVRSVDPGVSHVRYKASLDDRRTMEPAAMLAVLSRLCTGTGADTPSH